MRGSFNLSAAHVSAMWKGSGFSVYPALFFGIACGDHRWSSLSLRGFTAGTACSSANSSSGGIGDELRNNFYPGFFVILSLVSFVALRFSPLK